MGTPNPYNGMLQDVGQDGGDHLIEGPGRDALQGEGPILDGVGLGTLVSKASEELFDGPPFPPVQWRGGVVHLLLGP